jgi:hypothetical protein
MLLWCVCVCERACTSGSAARWAIAPPSIAPALLRFYVSGFMFMVWFRVYGLAFRV